jgi:hypothetical protein
VFQVRHGHTGWSVTTHILPNMQYPESPPEVCSWQLISKAPRPHHIRGARLDLGSYRYRLVVGLWTTDLHHPRVAVAYHRSCDIRRGRCET